MIGVPLRIVGVVALSLLGANCSQIDSIDSRAQTMNRGVANYYSEAILLNLIRASRSEPLAFVSLSGVTGHNTIQGNIGLPSITVGPHTPVVPPGVVPARNYTFGPNSTGATVSNDFNASVVDDPLSYAALLAPTNPATIGFFINQGYSREVLFYLFVDRIKIVDAKGATIEEYENAPPISSKSSLSLHGPQYDAFQFKNFECFQNHLGFMIREGFTAQVDADALPSGKSTTPANRFCADPGLRVWFRQSLPSQYCKGLLTELATDEAILQKPVPGRLTPICNSQARWTISRTDTGAKTDVGSLNPTASSSSTSATASGNSQVTVSLSSKLAAGGRTGLDATATSTGPTPVSVTVQAPPPVLKQQRLDKSDMLDACTGMASGHKVGEPRPGYEMCIDRRRKVQVFLRSAFSVYEYLGKMVGGYTRVSLYTGIESDPNLITVTSDFSDCYVSTIYDGANYCVPNSATNTKRIFGLLRQLVGLNTSVANQPSTLTVRTTP